MGKDVNAMHFSCFRQSLLSTISFNFRELAGWDFTPSVGLVVAGGWTATTLHTNTAEISYDYGASFESLPNLPEGIAYNCVVIVGNKESHV